MGWEDAPYILNAFAFLASLSFRHFSAKNTQRWLGWSSFILAAFYLNSEIFYLIDFYSLHTRPQSSCVFAIANENHQVVV